jgi:quinol monooxygenase YgiN
MFRAVTEWRIKPGHEDAFVDAWTELVTWSRGMFSGREAILLRRRDDPGRFLAIGTFPSDDVIQEWRQIPGMRERFDALTQLAVSYDMQNFDQVVEVS